MRSLLQFYSIGKSFRFLNGPVSFSSLLSTVSSGKPPALFNKKVLFNWDKIKNLRGYEKIDLFRDYARTADTENAFKIYMIMKENDLLVRLTYIDHHKMFHLLIKDKQKHRENIIDLWNWLKSNQYYPSVGLYKDLFTCYKTWRDLKGAKELYQEMVDNNLEIVPEIHEIMLSLYANCKNAINYLEGIKLWNQIKDTKLTPRMVAIVLELYGKLKMSSAATDLLESTSGIFAKDGYHFMKLQTVYLGALINSEDYNEAIEFYEKNFQGTDRISGHTNLHHVYKTVYQMMMKLCYKTHNLELAEEILYSMENLGIFVNDAMKCRLLVIAGINRDVEYAEELYKSQTQDVNSKKILSTYKLALIEVYTTKLQRKKAEELISWFTIKSHTLIAKSFLEKMYRNLGDTAEAERMAKMIKDSKKSPEEAADL